MSDSNDIPFLRFGVALMLLVLAGTTIALGLRIYDRANLERIEEATFSDEPIPWDRDRDEDREQQDPPTR